MINNEDKKEEVIGEAANQYAFFFINAIKEQLQKEENSFVEKYGKAGAFLFITTVFSSIALNMGHRVYHASENAFKQLINEMKEGANGKCQHS